MYQIPGKGSKKVCPAPTSSYLSPGKEADGHTDMGVLRAAGTEEGAHPAYTRGKLPGQALFLLSSMQGRKPGPLKSVLDRAVKRVRFTNS